MSPSQGTAARFPSRAEDGDKHRWRHRAACQGEDSDLFFPVASDAPARARIIEAKKICGRCPVRQACLGFARATRQEYGIWGGLTEDERRRFRRRAA